MCVPTEHSRSRSRGASVRGSIPVGMVHPWNLNDAEHAAILALQRGTQAPHPEDPVWSSLIEKRLVWLDFSRRPPEFLLTPLGWRYPQSS